MSLTIFLSTVTTEFPDYRAKLRAELVGVQVEIKDQEYFKNYGVTTLAKLDLYVSESDYVVHLVGDMPGALPPATSVEALAAKYKDCIDRLPPLREALTAGVSLSYAQWEAWLALIHDKRLIIAEATPAAPRRPEHKADDALQSAQRAHVERLKRLGHWPSPVDDAGDLAKLVLHLLLGGRRLSVREPGRLSGPRDNRLEPREGKVYGRTDEVAKVLAFLRGTDTAAVVSAHVTGVGGIGKTEVCKAALKDWLTERPNAAVYYVDVPDRATADELVYRVARSLGRDAIDSLDRLLLEMPDGLYYLDNLESVAEAPGGIETLRALRARAGVRVLASCRVDLAGLFGTPIDMVGLPILEAILLFRNVWNGSDVLPDDAELSSFIEHQLGCHALSVTLTARLGPTYSFPELVQRWKGTGALMARSLLDPSRLGSLRVSLHLSAEALAHHPGTLALWTAVALFATGIPGDLLDQLEDAGGWGDARSWLVAHHLLVRRGDLWQVLPPVGRYALDMSRAAQDGFDWVSCRKALQRIFETLAGQADSIASTADSLKGRARFLEHFSTWARFVGQDLAAATPDFDWLEPMLDRTRNSYQFRTSVGREVLHEMSSRLPRPALAIHLLGDLELQLGRVDEARKLYDRALGLSEREQTRLGQANTLRALGDLELRLGRIDEARKMYGRAFALFAGEQDRLGQANTLKGLGNLELRLGRVDEAQKLYERALTLFDGLQSGLGQANTLRALGDVELRLGRINEARQLYGRALSLYEGGQVRRGQANALRALGDLEFQQGRVDAARALYDHALALFEGEQDGLGQANALDALGDLEIRLGRVDEARTLYNRALGLFKGERDGLGQANTLEALGNLEFRLGRVDDARKLYDRALALFEGEQDGLGQAKSLLRLGNLEFRLSRLEEARKRYDHALVLFEGGRASSGQANTLRALGDLEHRLGRVEEARRLYDRALALFEGGQSGLGQANTLRALGGLERESGQVERAITFYENALSIYQREQEPMGTAHTFAELARCWQSREERNARDEALLNAFAAAEQARTESVVQYVVSALVEVTGGRDAALAWIDAANSEAIRD